MKATITFGTMFTLALLSPLSLHAQERVGPTIRILSPQEGQTVTGTIEVSYTLQEGFTPEYVHVFLDGFYKKDFSGTLTNVPKGPHHITIKVAPSKKDGGATWDTVHFEVN